MQNQDIIEVIKAAITTAGGTGIASPQDAQDFIDLAVEQTAVLGEIRVETGIKNSLNLDTLSFGEPILVSAVEGTAPAEADVVAAARGRKVLTPKAVVAAVDVTYDFLRKNIEGARVNESLNRIIAKRFGKDLVLVALMGDTGKPSDTRTNKALRTFDGVLKKALADAAVRQFAVGVGPSYCTQVFPGMLNLLPKDYRDDRADLRFFVSADVYDAYAQEIGERATALGDMILAGPWGKALSYMGIRLVPVFGLATNRVLLTMGQNLAVGFGQEMTFGIDWDNRARLMKVTITADIDASHVEGDALVVGVGA